MLNMRQNFERFHLGTLAGFAGFVIFTTCSFNLVRAQQPQQKFLLITYDDSDYRQKISLKGNGIKAGDTYSSAHSLIQ